MATPGLTQPRNAVKIIRGVSKTFELTVKDEAGDPVDLTSGRVLFSVKTDLQDLHAIIQKDSDAGAAQVELTEPKAGKAQIKLDPSDTNTLDVREYVFDVWVILSNGKRHAVIPPSIFEIQAGVTVIT